MEPKTNNLQKIRIWKNLTQVQLSEKAHVSINLIRRMEKAGSYYQPRYPIVRKLSKALDVEPKDIIGGEQY